MPTPDQVAVDRAVADDPTDLSREHYKTAFKRTVDEIKDADVPSLAAGVAFKIFLAIFPSLLAAVAVFSIVTTPAEIEEWLNEARGFLPSDAIELLQRPLRRLAEGGGGGAGATAVIGIAVGLFAASSAAVSLMKALSRSYDVDETRKLVKQRLQALALTLALLAALVSLVLLLVVGRQLQEAVLPGAAPPLTWLLAGVRFLLALVVLVLLFAFVYWIGPDRDQPRWVWISPGAVLGVVGWLLVSGGFTLYARTAGNYDATYGAVAGVAVLLIWLQLSMLVVLIGGEFNAEVERIRALQRMVADGAGWGAPAASSAGVPPDVESLNTTIRQAETAAHTTQTLPGGDDDTAEVPATRPPPPPEAQMPAEDDASGPRSAKAGAVVAALTALGIFLGFARRRARR